jgi:ATP-dependent protease ClpP protease subunit
MDTKNLLLDEGVDLINKAIYFHGPIESNFCFLIRTRILLLRETIKLDLIKEVNLYIDSNGGDLAAVLATLDYFNLILARNGVKVNIIAERCCYSAALVLLAGTTGKRYSTPSTLFMYHEFESKMESLTINELINDRVKTILSKTLILANSNLIFSCLNKTNYYFNSTEALEREVVDEILC